MINPKYIIYHDLIGFTVYAKLKFKNSKFSKLGNVIDETRNMLITKKDQKIKKYIKKNYKFRFEIPKYRNDNEDYYLEVEGNKIIGAPLNRLRSLKKKRWLKK